MEPSTEIIVTDPVSETDFVNAYLAMLQELELTFLDTREGHYNDMFGLVMETIQQDWEGKFPLFSRSPLIGVYGTLNRAEALQCISDHNKQLSAAAMLNVFKDNEVSL